MTETCNIVVTGDTGFIKRYRFFREALAERCESLVALPSGDTYDVTLSGKAVKAMYKIARTLDPKKSFGLGEMHKRKTAFLRKSRQTERKLQRLARRPDLVFHVFGMYAPFLHKSTIPYTMTLDYTMALAIEEWPAWAPFDSDRDRRDWLEVEGDAYKRAAHLFPWSNRTKQSLVRDYGISEDKITVIGSAGQFRHPYAGPKSFGSRRLLFNGSDWDRKGGDLVLAAFRKVRLAMPDTTLVVIGIQKEIAEPGVDCPGHLSPDAVQDLMLRSDLLLAPARCEPYGNFLVEGMNYGVPCIAASRGGMPEIVDHGVNGLVLEETSPDTLADAIVSLLSDTARLERFSESARLKVKTELNWDSIVTKIFEALHQRGILPAPPP